MLNAIAPPSFQGMDPAGPTGFVDVSFGYIYTINLTSLQALQGQVVSIFTEADFVWRGLVFTSTGTFSVQFQDGQGYYLSSDLVFSTNMPNTAGDPFPQFPEILYPAGGRIYLNITDTSGSSNTGQLLFMGANRYALS